MGSSLLGRIKQVVHKRLLSVYKKILFSPKSCIYKCNFEGLNAVGENTVINNSNIGIGSYIGSDCRFNNVLIGRYCSIASGINGGLGTHPTSLFVSTHPAFYYNTKHQLPFTFHYNENRLFKYEILTKNGYAIEIGNDVWIGTNAIISDGVVIGDGAIIAAGAVVTKDVEPYSLVGGIPAKHIKYRFDKEQINFLLQDKWWLKDYKWISENYLKFSDIEKYIKWIQIS